MSDFASAAMGRVLLEGMRLQGIKPPHLKEIGKQEGAKIQLDFKRQLLEVAVSQRGLSVLILLGEGLHKFAHEPTHLALCSARSPFEMVQRWQKLERYIHSRHRIKLVAQAEFSVTLQHVALAGFPAPLFAEDLVVLGVILALCKANGADEISATFGGLAVFPHCNAPELKVMVESGSNRGADWKICWKHRSTREYPQVESVPLSDWPATATRVFQFVAESGIEQITINSVARKLGYSVRSLQRELNGSGLTFTEIQSSERVQRAGRYLLGNQIAVAEVGFLCGYSDQAHFTRQFKKATGVTPAKYRESFAGKSTGASTSTSASLSA